MTTEENQRQIRFDNEGFTAVVTFDSSANGMEPIHWMVKQLELGTPQVGKWTAINSLFSVKFHCGVGGL